MPGDAPARGVPPELIMFGAVVYCVIFGGVGAYIANQRRRLVREGVALGIFFGPLGLLIEALLPTMPPVYLPWHWDLRPAAIEHGREVTAKAAEAPRGDGPAPALPEMITFKCRECQHEITSPISTAGKRGRRPRCQQPVKVPG